MRRSRRGRLIHWGLIFLIYSAIQVYSASIRDATTESSDVEEPKLAGDDEVPANISPNPNFEGSSVKTDDLADVDTHTTVPTINVVPNEGPGYTTTTAPKRHSHPTLRPRRENCTAPAIEQFPQPLMGPYVRRHGGLVLHVLVAIFTFLGLAIVCDDYFVSSLDRICEELKLSPDVAGATFMAAGSSAPELATVIIGVFFAKDDIGISGVIGSAVFNIMFVISVCALCSGTVCHLNWWPLVRDCFFYSISILVMLIIIFNDYISWYEALIMMIFYVIYCIALHFNTPLERWAHSLKLPIKLPTKEEQSALVTYKNLPDTTTYSQAQAVTSLSNEPPAPATSPPAAENYQDYTDPNSSWADTNASWDPNAAWSDQSATATGVAPSAPAANNSFNTAPSTNSWDPNASWDQAAGQQNYAYSTGGGDQTGDQATVAATSTAKAAGQQQQQQQPQTGAIAPGGTEYYKSKDPKAHDIGNPLEKPVDGGLPAQISWAIVYPIHYMCRLTMPDCRTEKYRNWYAFTFFVSMIWISFYSYFMVWMITIIGSTLGIPDTVMGLTFVAAGVSVPDALSSIAVIKEGYGDMAVSNAVGSNVFDILICLGLPWFIQTTMIDPGGHVNVLSKGLTYSTLSLLSTVIFLLASVHLNGWKLDKRLGIILMVWYLLFITLASLYELNVFGQLNPPECSSGY